MLPGAEHLEEVSSYFLAGVLELPPVVFSVGFEARSEIKGPRVTFELRVGVLVDLLRRHREKMIPCWLVLIGDTRRVWGI